MPSSGGNRFPQSKLALSGCAFLCGLVSMAMLQFLEEESPRFSAVVRVMLAMEFSGSIISPSIKSRIFNEQAIRRALKTLLQVHKGNWSVIQAKGYQIVVDHILQEAEQSIKNPTSRLLGCKKPRLSGSSLPDSSKPEQQQELDIVPSLVDYRSAFERRLQRLKSISTVCGIYQDPCDSKPAAIPEEKPCHVMREERQTVAECHADPWDGEQEAAADPQCHVTVQDEEQEAAAVLQCHVMVQDSCDQKQEAATRQERPCAFSGSIAGIPAMPLDMPLVRDSQMRQLVSSGGSLPWSLVVAGISKGSITGDQLKELAERILCNFEFVPDCSRFLNQVEMYCELEEDDCAVMGFSSEAVAELFLDACSDDAQFPFAIDGKKLTLARNYYSPRMEADKEDLIKALRTSSLVPRRIVCVKGVPEEWADQSRLRRHFEKIVRGSDDFQLEEVIKSVHVQPCLAVAYLELASDSMVDTLFYRCSKDASHLQEVGKDLFICRSSKCIPMLHFSRNAVYPVRVPAAQSVNSGEANEGPRATGIKVEIHTKSQYPVATGSEAEIPLVNFQNAPASGSKGETFQRKFHRASASGIEVEVPQTKSQSAPREIEDPHDKSRCTAAAEIENASKSEVKVPQTSGSKVESFQFQSPVVSGTEVEVPQANVSRREIEIPSQSAAATEIRVEIQTNSQHVVAGSGVEIPRKGSAACGSKEKIFHDKFASGIPETTSQSAVDVSQSSSQRAATAQMDVEIRTNSQDAASGSKVGNANALGQAQKNNSQVDTKRLSSARTQQNCTRIDANQKIGAQTQHDSELPQSKRFKRDTSQVHNPSAIGRSNSQNSTNGQSDVLDQAPENNSQVDTGQSNSPSSVNVGSHVRTPETDTDQTKLSRSSAQTWSELPQSKRKRLGRQSSQVHPSRETSRNLMKGSWNFQRRLFIANLLPEAHDPERLKDILCNLLMRVMPRQMAADGIKNIHWSPGKRVAQAEFRSEATADALMDAYIAHTRDLCIDDFPLSIYRHAEYVRPGGGMQGIPVEYSTRNASVTIAGIPGGLHPVPLKGALIELLERVLAANSFSSFHPKSMLQCFLFNKGGTTAFATFRCAAALEFLLSLQSGFSLAGGKIVLIRTENDIGLCHRLKLSVHDRLGPRGASGEDQSSGDEAGYREKQHTKRKNHQFSSCQ